MSAPGAKGPLLVYEQAVEALFVRALEGKLTGRCKDRLLKETGLDLSRKLKPTYPLEAWLKMLEVARQELFSTDSVPNGYRKLGEAIVDGYENTLLGRTVLAMARLLGPKKSLARAAQNFRSANSYMETKLTELGPGHFELWANEVGQVDFSGGILLAGLRHSGAKDPEVTVKQTDGHEAIYVCRWRE